MTSRASLPFADEFDRHLAANGPPAVFRLSPDGELRLSPDRTRDAWQRLSSPPTFAPCHVLARDCGTGVVSYLLVTSPQLCEAHPRADLWRYGSQEEALAALARAGRPPVWRGGRL